MRGQVLYQVFCSAHAARKNSQRFRKGPAKLQKPAFSPAYPTSLFQCPPQPSVFLNKQLLTDCKNQLRKNSTFTFSNVKYTRTSWSNFPTGNHEFGFPVDYSGQWTTPVFLPLSWSLTTITIPFPYYVSRYSTKTLKVNS